MYALIVNPAAGNGKALEVLPELCKLLDARGLTWTVHKTQEPGMGGTLAREALAQGAETVIAVGGDGTISEIAGGMKFSGIPLLFASCGTGNDFIRTAKLPRDPVEALKLQLDAPIGQIDLGRANDRNFLNVAGTGLDVNVLVEAEKYKATSSGLKPYLHGVADAIRHFSPLTAQISFDGEELHETKFTILSIGNGQYFGGGMRAVPGAQLNDGCFDVLEARPVKKWMIPFLMALFIPGLHAKTALTKRRLVQKLRIVCPGMVLNLDGELTPSDEAEFEVLPGALTVRLPMLK